MGKVDIAGVRFGRLVATERAGTDKHRLILWRCKCDCGNEHIARHTDLRSGKTKSCGCLNREMVVKRSTTHGLSGNHNHRRRLYKIWIGMKGRCYNPKASGYKNYGGRGIIVCKEWLEYMPFHQWAMSHGYQENLTIERIDNDGNYEPDNCTWIPIGKQAMNKCNNRQIIYNGESKLLIEWSRLLGINKSTLHRRLKGWSVEKAFNTPVKKRRRRQWKSKLI